MTAGLRRVLILAGLWGCVESGSAPVDLHLETPFPDDGALVVTITADPGQGLLEVAPACDGCAVYGLALSAREVRAVVTGNLQSGPLLQVTVSDPRQLRRYQARVESAASREHLLRATIEGYRLSFRD